MSLSNELLLQKEVEESGLQKFVTEVAAFLEKDSILLLAGDLGAGKTTFVRQLCQHYGLSGVQSPTYAIHQRYSSGLQKVDHFDLYRLQTEEELISTGFWDLLHEEDSLVLIEWFERIEDPIWLQFEVQKRKVLGLKIQVQNKKRVYQLFRLT